MQVCRLKPAKRLLTVGGKKKRYHPPDPDSVKMLRLKLTRTLEMPQSHISPFSKGIDILQLLNYN